jgi:hypothetical protein
MTQSPEVTTWAHGMELERAPVGALPPESRAEGQGGTAGWGVTNRGQFLSTHYMRHAPEDRGAARGSLSGDLAEK